MENSIRISLLGTPALFCETTGAQITLPQSAMQLLIYLATKNRQPVLRELAIEELWPETEPERAQSRFSTTLWRLNKAMGGREVVEKTSTHTIVLSADVIVDIHLFDEVSAQFLSEPSVSGWEQLSCFDIGRLHPLEGWYSLWALREKTRLENLWEACLEELLQLQRESGDISAALKTADRLLMLDPLREDIHAIKMQIFIEQERPAMAQHQFNKCAEVLHRDLGEEPGPALCKILAQSKVSSKIVEPMPSKLDQTDIQAIQELLRKSRTDLRKVSDWLESQI